MGFSEIRERRFLNSFSAVGLQVPVRIQHKIILSTLKSYSPKGPSTQIVGFQSPKTIQSMDFGT